MKCEIKVFPEAEAWTSTEYFCPHCGLRTVWESGFGDFYTGPNFLCESCGWIFSLPFAPDPNGLDNPKGAEKAKAIREAEHIMEPSDSIPPD
jgi:predicted RNA-binding Zn-ribbon protein involved in translation (DUF1610 family)